MQAGRQVDAAGHLPRLGGVGVVNQRASVDDQSRGGIGLELELIRARLGHIEIARIFNRHAHHAQLQVLDAALKIILQPIRAHRSGALVEADADALQRTRRDEVRRLAHRHLAPVNRQRHPQVAFQRRSHFHFLVQRKGILIADRRENILARQLILNTRGENQVPVLQINCVTALIAAVRENHTVVRKRLHRRLHRKRPPLNGRSTPAAQGLALAKGEDSPRVLLVQRREVQLARRHAPAFVDGQLAEFRQRFPVALINLELHPRKSRLEIRRGKHRPL